MAFFRFNNKKVFYKVIGTGEPLLLIHGNSVSSKMFSGVLKSYMKKFQVVLIDFPGHGKSERLEIFETDFWFYNARVCLALLEELKLEMVNVIGTSGGALVAINLALENPEKVKSLIADSFEGEYPLKSYIKNIREDRKRDKKKWLAKFYWWYFHGWDWKNVVDMDTDVNIEFANSNRSFFHKSISELTVPTLLTGSKKDEYCEHLEEIYLGMQRKNHLFKMHLFEEGNHPAMLSNKKEFFEIASNNFLK